MTSFKTYRGKLALLDWSDVNTDLIIPARYLKRIERTGYGPLLFADKRYVAGGAPPVDQPTMHGSPDPAFPLNDSIYHDSAILLVGRNFGCGSSREHAVWAVAQAGYRVLIAPGLGSGFADIFEQNALNNGMLPIELPEAEWDALAEAARSAREATVDLESQSISLHLTEGPEVVYDFSIPQDQRHRLLNGLDAIADTLRHEAAIARHERGVPPWAVPLPG